MSIYGTLKPKKEELNIDLVKERCERDIFLEADRESVDQFLGRQSLWLEA